MAVAPEPERVQLGDENVPVEFVIQLTEPLGLTAVPVEVSATVAVHDVDWPV